MKKLSIFCLFVLTFLSACAHTDSSTQPQPQPQPRGYYGGFDVEYEAYKGLIQDVEYGDHTFTVFSFRKGISAVHSPDCRCEKN